jgi:hypothetical protein
MNPSDLTDLAVWPNETLEAYFLSIKPAFEKTLEERSPQIIEEPSSALFLIFLIIFLLFSLVPAIPGLLTFTFTHLLHRETVIVHTVTIPTGSFLFWYLATTLGSIALLGIKAGISSWQTRRKKRNTPRSSDLLNEPQMRFALCYALISELDAYRTNKRQTHIHTARTYWRELLGSLREAFGVGEGNLYRYTSPAYDTRMPSSKPCKRSQTGIGCRVGYSFQK